MNIDNLSELRANVSPELIAANPEIFGIQPVAKSQETARPCPRTGIKSKSGTTILEKDLQADVIEFLHGLGYKVLVTGAARTGHGEKERYITPYRADGKGFPDIFAVKSGRMLALELKSDIGKASPEQVEWLLALSLCGALTGIVTPSTWEKMKLKIQEIE